MNKEDGDDLMIRNYRLVLVDFERVKEEVKEWWNCKEYCVPYSNSILKPEIFKYSTKLMGSALISLAAGPSLVRKQTT